MNTLGVILRAELRSLARNRWLAAYAAVFFLIAEGLFFFGGTGPQVVLSLLNAMLLIAPLVCLVFGTIHVYGSREFVELLLAQPVSRTSLFTGLYCGLALPLTVALLAGVCLPFALHGAGGGLGALMLLAAAGTALSFTFSAIATLIALRTDDRLRGVGIALGVWLASTLVYDALVLATTAAFGEWPLEKPLLAAMLLNPVDVARMLVLTRLDVTALLGYTGAVFHRTFGTALGITVSLLALAGWSATPFWLARRRFSSRDF